MNWYDYIRGYDDGQEDSWQGGAGNGLMFSLLRLAFSIVFLLVALAYWILKTVVMLLWTRVKTISGR